MNSDAAATKEDVYVPSVFWHAVPTLVTVSSGLEGTKIYVAGVLARAVPQLHIPASAFSGQLLLGDSPGQPDNWRGQVFGLAVYDSELTAAQVQRHYSGWTKSHHPEVSADEQPVALYLFDEHEGQIIHNQIKPGADLFIPNKYTVVGKIFLEPLWEEFDFSRSYWSAALKNIVGFIPFGFCFYAYFVAYRNRRAGLLTVAFGTVVSVTIEVLQAFLPTRDSGMTDIVTNTLGTWGGVLLYQSVCPILEKRFSWFPS